MCKNIVYNFIGKVLIGFSLLLIFPIIIACIYKENFLPFLMPLIISLIIGILLNFLDIKNEIMYVKDGLKIASLSWVIISLLGALPIFLNNDANFIDSFFEIVSGFTTTGATVFENVENLNKSILFWRSFSHYIGGMGVLAFVIMIIPLAKNDKSMHVLKAEMHGPNKIVPSIKKTLIYLYGVYVFLTLIELILLIIGGLNFFDGLLISMGTASTGGFSILNTSLMTYSVFNKCVVTIFMLLFGINFNIYFLLIRGKIKNILKSEELKLYFFIYVSTVLFVLISNLNAFDNFFSAIVDVTFHVSSILSTTGFSVGNIDIYSTSSKIILLLLMIVGACSGSTCGGFKLSRIIIIFKLLKRNLKRIVHPNNVEVITFEGKIVSEDTIKSTNSLLQLYIIIIIILLFIVGFDGYSIEKTINAVFTTFANVGVCFNINNFASFSNLSKIALSMGMILGRLEIFPIVVLLADFRLEKNKE